MKTNSTHYLFVYGSLRSGFKSPAYQYIAKYFTLAAQAKTKGRLYNMGTYPVGVPVTDNAYIIGELYTINNPSSFDFAIGQLDDYEGVNTELGDIPQYKRETAEVWVEEQVFTAWVYWYTGDIQGKEVITSGDVLQYFNDRDK